MKQIRKGVFETNSSSVHSLSISGADRLSHVNRVSGSFGEFGWGYERLNTVEDRLSYLLTDIARKYDDYKEKKRDILKERFLSDKHYRWANEMVKEFTGNEVEMDWDYFYSSSWSPFGYIDHQSISDMETSEDHSCILKEFFSDDEMVFKENMKDFVFNNKYQLIIDNDNH